MRFVEFNTRQDSVLRKFETAECLIHFRRLLMNGILPPAALAKPRCFTAFGIRFARCLALMRYSKFADPSREIGMPRLTNTQRAPNSRNSKFNGEKFDSDAPYFMHPLFFRHYYYPRGARIWRVCNSCELESILPFAVILGIRVHVSSAQFRNSSRVSNLSRSLTRARARAHGTKMLLSQTRIISTRTYSTRAFQRRA